MKFKVTIMIIVTSTVALQANAYAPTESIDLTISISGASANKKIQRYIDT